ncbi:type VII secretion protein EssA [Neobacillus soli]|nr:type VII secretion protein EssA [Neobacillus soli]
MELVKRTSLIAVFLLGVGSFFTLHSSAEGHLDHSGEIRIEIERIGQDDREREKLASQDQKETELEKIMPDLFKEQTRAAIVMKQNEMTETMDKLQQTLFETPIEADTTTEIKTALFTNDNMVKYAAVAKQNKQQTDEEGISKKTVAALFGSVLVICAGLLAMMRQMLN